MWILGHFFVIMSKPIPVKNYFYVPFESEGTNHDQKVIVDILEHVDINKKKLYKARNSSTMVLGAEGK